MGSIIKFFFLFWATVTVFGQDNVGVLVSASSTLLHQGESARYGASNIHDFDPYSIWAEGADGDGIGESLRLEFYDRDPEMGAEPHSVSVASILVRPGFFDQRYWKANNRLRSATISYEGGYLRVQFTDTMTKQYVQFETPIRTSWLELRIDSVYPGDRWDDTCISEFMPLSGRDRDLAPHFVGGAMLYSHKDAAYNIRAWRRPWGFDEAFYIDLEPIHFFQPILRLEAQKGETKGVAKGTAIVSPQVGNQADFNGQWELNRSNGEITVQGSWSYTPTGPMISEREPDLNSPPPEKRYRNFEYRFAPDRSLLEYKELPLR